MPRTCPNRSNVSSTALRHTSSRRFHRLLKIPQLLKILSAAGPDFVPELKYAKLRSREEAEERNEQDKVRIWHRSSFHTSQKVQIGGFPATVLHYYRFLCLLANFSPFTSQFHILRSYSDQIPNASILPAKLMAETQTMSGEEEIARMRIHHVETKCEGL